MAYSINNLALVFGRIGTGPRIWMYTEASLAAAAVDLAGYISDGGKAGMGVGDLVLHLNQATGIWSGHSVVSINATTGAVDLSNGTTIADGSSNSD